jgi:hypothetical protein
MPGARVGRPHWLITKYDRSKMNVLTLRLDGDAKALPVFGFEEEAEMFLHLRRAALGEGWSVRQTSAGELVSVLYGPCADVKEVVMDPAPGVGKKELVGILSMHRNHFLRVLLGEGPSRLHLIPSRAPRLPRRRVEHSSIA